LGEGVAGTAAPARSAAGQGFLRAVTERGREAREGGDRDGEGGRGGPGRLLVQEGVEQEVAAPASVGRARRCLPGRGRRREFSENPLGFGDFPRKAKTAHIQLYFGIWQFCRDPK
jgi:hypothetical protein